MLAPLFLLLLAGWIRVPQILSNPFLSPDQGRALLVGRNILAGHWLTWGPDTSVSGVALGPLYYYWTALWLAISRYQLWGPALGAVIAGLASIFLTWYFIRREFGTIAAVVGAGWLAVSPLFALQSSIALEPTLLPLWTIVWLIGLTNLLRNDPSLENFYRNKNAWLVGISLVGAVQANASAVILGAGTLSVWWWRSGFLSETWKRRIWGLGLVLLAFGIVGKALTQGTTSLDFWWQMWQRINAPNGMSGLWVTLLWSALGLWGVCKFWQEKSKNIPMTLIFVVLSWSLWAFTAKTISGEHALNIVFVPTAVLLGATVKMALPRSQRYPRAFVTVYFLFLMAQAVLTRHWLQEQTHARAQDFAGVVEHIKDLAQGEPYALLYTGHLDIYPAADDHLLYLLWLGGSQPTAATRQTYPPQTDAQCEKLLLDSSDPEKTLNPKRLIHLDVPVNFPTDPVTITVQETPAIACHPQNRH